MKKRVLSLVMAVAMLLCLCGGVPVAAADAPAAVAEDFTPGAVTGNMVNTYPTEGHLDINSGEVRATASGDIATLSAVTSSSVNPDHALQGFIINNKFVSDLSSGCKAPLFTVGTKAVFSAKVRKAADATQNAKINVAYSIPGAALSSAWHYPDNCATGFVVTSTEWTEFKAVITPRENIGGNQYWELLLGFQGGTTEGANIEIDMTSIYIGAEYAHDINLEVAGTTNVEAGTGATVSADADILNQCGGKYSSQGTFNWYALDETRTQIVSGITIVPGADGTATITAGSSVPAGKYVIAVQSAEYPAMVRSFELTVGEKDWTDHVPVTTNSWYTNPGTEQNWSGHLNGVPSTTIGAGATGTTITKTDITVVEEIKDRLMGVKLLDMVGAASGTPQLTYPAGSKFLISFKVKNLTPEKTAKINAAMYGYGTLRSLTPDEYPSVSFDDCFTVVGSDWNEFKGIFTLPSAETLEWYSLDIGYPNGTETGVMIEIDNSSFYLAPYKASDIKITNNSGKAELDPGVASSFTADVVDSAGNAMGGAEEFRWNLLDSNRKSPVSGVTFTPDTADATTVNVTVDKTVTPGDYYLVAESTANDETSGWIKSIPVKVLKPTIKDYVAGTLPGAIDDIVITRTDSGSQTMGLTDTAAFSASVVDAGDVPVSGEQKFVWFVMDETRKENVSESFTVTPSGDTATVTIMPKLTTVNGTYYVMAQYKDNEEIVKAIKIVIDKAQSVSGGAELINNGTAVEIAAQLSDIAVIVEASEKIQTALSEGTGKVKEKAAEILAASFDNSENVLATNDMNAAKEAVEKAVVVALYSENPASVALYDSEGKFVFADELGLDEIDTAGVTLYEVFDTVLSNEGRTAMQKELASDTIDGFTEAVKENIVLYGVKYPNEIGVTYLEKILTEENLSAAGISAPNYIARADKSETHKTIARTLYTKETLAAALEAEPQIGGTIGGTTGGIPSGTGGGGGYSAHIETAPEDKESGETTQIPDFPKFSDVPEKHWAYADIYYLRERNIINGLDAKTYNPDGYITREQFAKILCAALEIEPSSNDTGFTDVDADAWYAPYISAVHNEGIVTGISDETFGVGAYITRQDLCTMIYRAIDSEKYAYTTLGFADDDSISEYARNAVATLKGLEIVNGYEDGSFNPAGLCTRAEAAKIIYKLLAVQEVLR